MSRANPIKNAPVIGLLSNRLVFDELEMIMDPEAAHRKAQLVEKIEKNGGKFWWRPQGMPGESRATTLRRNARIKRKAEIERRGKSNRAARRLANKRRNRR